MFEGFVAWVLNTYIGAYVDDLNTQDLSFGILQGFFELHNLPLKKDALRKLDLPVEIKAGVVGKIRCEIPIRALRSEPWIISVEGVYLVAGPPRRPPARDDAEDDPHAAGTLSGEEEEKTGDMEKKKALLAAHEAKWTAENSQEGSKQAEASSSSWFSFGTAMVANIVENIQLDILDIHVRYEDDVSDPSRKPFAFGLTIRQLSTKSTDVNWSPQFVSHAATDIMHKIWRLDDFSVYLDSDVELIVPVGSSSEPGDENGEILASPKQLVQRMRELESKAVSGSKPHSYVLGHISLEAKLKRNISELPLKHRTSPRINCDINLEHFTISYTEKQHRLLHGVLRELERNNRAWRFRHRRPCCSVLHDPRRWWRFAIEAHLDRIRERDERRTRDFILGRAKSNVLYARGYAQKLTSYYGTDYYLRPTMEVVEKDYSFDEIRVLREAVHDRIRRDKKRAATRVKKGGKAESANLAAAMAEETEADSVLSDDRAQAPNPETAQVGWIQWAFPSWGGWVSQDPVPPLECPSPSKTSSSATTAEEAERIIEEEVWHMVSETSAESASLFKKDVVFAHINFSLDAGTIQLIGDRSTFSTLDKHGPPSGPAPSSQTVLVKFDFCDVAVVMESRPRTASSFFSLRLGSVLLQDHLTSRALYPVLVQSQAASRAAKSLGVRPGAGGTTMGASLPRSGSGIRLSDLRPLEEEAASQKEVDPLFEFVFEKRPFSSNAHYALQVRTKAIDIVYNPQVIRYFFANFLLAPSILLPDEVLSEGFARAHGMSEGLSRLALRRYQLLKRQTKDELRHTVDRLFAGESRETLGKRWDVHLDISAPVIFLPDKFSGDVAAMVPGKDKGVAETASQATVVVVDLGRLKLDNYCPNIVEKKNEMPEAPVEEKEKTKTETEADVSDDDDDDEDFLTPMSTPPRTPPNLEEMQVSASTTTTTGTFVSPMEAPCGPSAFVSPASEVSRVYSPSVDKERLTDDALRERIYDRYILHLSQLQILVGRAKDVFGLKAQRSSTPKSTPHSTPMHIVDRFSISLTLERRLFYTSDPTWPSVTISGTLPSLVFHANEQKVKAMQMCLSKLSSSESSSAPSTPTSVPERQKFGGDVKQGSTSFYNDASLSKSFISLSKTVDREVMKESILVLAQFSISQVSLEIQSLGRSISELQIYGVSSQFQKRPYDTSVNLSVQGLLVVDAMQTFGRDYELLVASHKNLFMDSRSGTIHDSPMSPPGTPDQSSVTGAGSLWSGAFKIPYLGDVFSGVGGSQTGSSRGSAQDSPDLGKSHPWRMSSGSSGMASPLRASRPNSLPSNSPRPSLSFPPNPFCPTENNKDALISFEYMDVSPFCPTNTDNECLHLVSVQFNTLDIIANQETFMELVSFVNRTFGGEPETKEASKSFPGEDVTDSAAAPIFSADSTDNYSREFDGLTHRFELTADFRRLNVLLMRIDKSTSARQESSSFMSLDYPRQEAHKVATLTLAEARFRASHGTESIIVEGSLGGLNVCDLTPACGRYFKVFHVGLDAARGSPRAQEGQARRKRSTSSPDSEDQNDQAFHFLLSYSKLPSELPAVAQPDESVEIRVDVASVCYTHSPRFLKELNETAKDFQNYIQKFKDSLRSAGARVARDIVSRKIDLLGKSFVGDPIGLWTPSKLLRGTSVGDSSLLDASLFHVPRNAGDEGPGNEMDEVTGSEEKSLRFNIDAVLQTPVIVIPRTPKSPEVLMAHLGRINLKNSSEAKTERQNSCEQKQLFDGRAAPNDSSFSASNSAVDRVHIAVNDMNLAAVNIDELLKSDVDDEFGGDYIVAAILNTNIGFAQKCLGKPILHDTGFVLDVNKLSNGNEDFNETGSSEIPGSSGASEYHVVGEILGPLKIVLSKEIYEQILQTVDHLTYDDYDERLAALRGKVDGTSVAEGVPRDDISSAYDLSLAHASNDVVKVAFKMPVFQVEIKGNFGADGEMSLVEFNFEEFSVVAEKTEKYLTAFEVELRRLHAEDLTQEKFSPSRFFLRSLEGGGSAGGVDKFRHRGGNKRDSRRRSTEPQWIQTSSKSIGGDVDSVAYLSTSCPNASLQIQHRSVSSSLPDKLESLSSMRASMNRVGRRQMHFSDRRSLKGGVVVKGAASSIGPNMMEPQTPPPSPTVLTASKRASVEKIKRDSSPVNLAHIKVRLVDKKHAEVSSERFHSMHRDIDAHFNAVEANINLQTLVVLLDFFGLGATVLDQDELDRAKSDVDDVTNSSSDWKQQDFTNTAFRLEVKSLSLLMCKPEYKIAAARVFELTVRAENKWGDTRVDGNLGSFSITDLTPHGSRLYPQRFSTMGQQALEFYFYKYGQPDPEHVLRPIDMSLKLRMSQVRYVFTHRFTMEVVTFLQHFNQLQVVLGRIRAYDEGRRLTSVGQCGARIDLDIEAVSPLLLVPHAASSKDILVAYLGNLTWRNQILSSGTPGTIAYRRSSTDIQSEDRSRESQPSPRPPETDAKAGMLSSMSSVSETSSLSSVAPDLPSLSNPLKLYQEASPMTSSIYGSLDHDHREDLLQKGALGAEQNFGLKPQALTTSASHYSVEQFEMVASGADTGLGSLGGTSTQPTSPVGDESLFRPIKEDSIDLPSPSLSRATTIDSISDTFSLLDEVEFPPPSTMPPCPSGLYGSLLTQSFGPQGRTNTVSSAFGTLIGKGAFGLGASPMAHEVPNSGTQPKCPESVSLASHGSRRSSSEARQCLLEVNHLALSEMDLFSGVWVLVDEAEDEELDDIPDELCFARGSGKGIDFVIRKDYGKFLKDQCQLTLRVERNLEGAISHSVPDFNVAGELSSVHCSLDVAQYQLIRGILDHNLGEQFTPLAVPADCRLHDPVAVLGPGSSVYKSISIAIDLTNVDIELLICHETEDDPQPISLALMHLVRSRLSYESYSDSSKDVDLVSQQIQMFDTRYRDEAVNNRPNVFTSVLRPREGTKANNGQGSEGTLQMEIHYRSTKDVSRFTILLNNMRLMGIFDWLFAVYDFILTKSENPFYDTDGQMKVEKPAPAPSKLPQGVVSKTTLDSSKSKSLPQTETPFELKLNITETDFVVLERQDKHDTYAVILKTTAVLNHRPHHTERPLSCSLQSIEVFSCSLGAESDTELSIVDPITITMEMSRNTAANYGAQMGLLAATENCPAPASLDIAVHQNLQFRLSYFDIKLFLAIANSLPAQTSSADSKRNSDAPLPPCANATATYRSKYPSSHVSRLKEFGYSEEDVFRALEACNGNLQESSIWLLDNANLRSSSSPSDSDQKLSESSNGSNLSEIKFRCSYVCVVLIDDCQDIDIPLAEISLNNVDIEYRILDVSTARGSATIAVDYYNRPLSGWEPFVEPWKARFSLTRSFKARDSNCFKSRVEVLSDDILNLNLTSCFVDLYQDTFKRWTEDFYGLLKRSDIFPTTYSSSETPMDTGSGVSGLRRRIPFVPFVLRNKTGVHLWFATITCAPDKLAPTSGGLTFRPEFVNTGEWRKVAPDQEFSFSFEDRAKQRHRNTRELRVHQVVVQVRGWNHVTPVSVDKVGTFFRVARVKQPETRLLDVGASMTNGAILDSQVIVFDVTLEGAAKKVITVRSDLRVTNRLGDEIEIMLDKGQIERGVTTRGILPTKVLRLAHGDTLPIPLPYTSAKMWVRPVSWMVDFCNPSVFWRRLKPNEITDLQLKCNAIMKEGDADAGDSAAYRFCVAVRKENFSSDLFDHRGKGNKKSDMSRSNSEGKSLSRQGDGTMSRSNSGHVRQVNAPTAASRARTADINSLQSGHHLVLVPTIVFTNLLPCELNYYVRPTNVRGRASPGESCPLRTVDLNVTLELGIQLENFPTCKELHIPPGTSDYRVMIRLFDVNNRQLELMVRIKARKGGALKLFVSAPYWLINKSGLPLVFKQDGAKVIAAGQTEAHEAARSVAPLLFSFTDREAHSLCSMRLGRALGSQEEGSTSWCQRFTIDRGIGVRQVGLHFADNRPPHMYNIGIEVRQGRGRYRDTIFVSFSPRFMLDNRSSHRLAFLQKHLVPSNAGSSKPPGSQPVPIGQVSALPNCTLPYHWSRVDESQLLCIRQLEVLHCNWSGGFKIDKVDSFHVNMRGESNVCIFLRVEVLLQGATFHIVFTDADQMPPPFRIDNFSEVQVMYYQTNAADGYRTMIKPWTSVDYAWDEPTLLPHMTCYVTGGTSATYNLNSLGDGDQLCYENFIYITFQATFDQRSSWAGQDPRSARQAELPQRVVEFDKNLVLDVVNGRVVLAPKEIGKRSQLWRMDAKGLLIHEGSSPPRNPRRPGSFASGSPSSKQSCFVLDIADTAVQPSRQTPLTIRRPENRRASTQTWHFTDDGRLRLKSVGVQNLVVQVCEAETRGIRAGAPAVLGPILRGSHAPKSIPPEMNIGRERMRPGSGFLAVRIIPDGPTRVLQITDIRNRSTVAAPLPLSTSVSSPEGWLAVDEELTLKMAKRKRRPQSELPATTYFVDLANEINEYNLIIGLTSGIGVSIVDSSEKVAEELVYLTVVNIEVDYLYNSTGQFLELKVGNIQVDNQILGSQRPVLLRVTPADSKTVKDESVSPDAAEASESFGMEPITSSITTAIQIVAQKQHAPIHRPLQNVEIYNNLTISIKRLTVQLEEKLLWRVLGFMGLGGGGAAATNANQDADYDEADLNAQVQAATSAQAKRYYFGQIKVITSRIKLSMLTSHKLPPDLLAIKEYWNIPMVKFEDAQVDLDPFIRVHPFETSAFLRDSIFKHYEDELKSQAAKILGSIDFLGNPLGLFNDITDGLSGLVKHGNVGGLFTNVTHGVSDSAAKVTGSLSDGLGMVVMDDKHMEIRENIRRTRGTGTGEHLMAGIKGLGFGIMSGVTSVITQTYEGASKEGVEGFITGFGKGVIGTVTKPALGILDFATGAASAIRDQSRGGLHHALSTAVVRPPRVCHGPGGLLPRYSLDAARGQLYLHVLNEYDYGETYVSHEELRGPPDNVSALVSSDHVYVLRKSRSGAGSDRPVLQISYAELYQCSYLARDNRHYIHLVLRTVRSENSTRASEHNRQQIRCETQNKAQAVVHQINYAKTLFEEKQLMLMPIPNDSEDNEFIVD